MASESDGINYGIYRKNTLIMTFVAMAVVCVGITGWYAPADWSVLRIIAAGSFGGALSFYCLFINHMLIHPAT